MKLSISNPSAISFSSARIALSLLVSASLAGAQTTFYVDDNAPGDPVHGISDPSNNTFSDPLEDGSPAHPFDDLWKGVAAASAGDEVVVLPSDHFGSYFLAETLDLAGKEITVRSQAGPAFTVLDGTSMPGQPGVLADSGETAGTVFEGFRLQNFDRGSSSNDLGGAMEIANGTPTIRACWFENNHAYRGAALYVSNSSSRIEDCRFVGNASVHQGGAVFTDTGAPTFSRCYFEGNTANFGGAFTSFTASATPVSVEDCLFYGNSSLVGYGGALSSHFTGSITIARSRFLANIAATTGGGAFVQRGLVHDCTFNSNVSSDNEGALRAGATGTVTVQSSTFFGNIGGACYETTGGDLRVRNSISWNNTPFEIGSNVDVQNCDVLGGFPGANIDVDPLFNDPQGADSILGTLDDDLSLFEGSPCIDAGDTTQLLPGYPRDLIGNPRAVDFPDTPDTGTALVGHTIDLGAYEYPAPPFQPQRVTVQLAR